MDKDEKITIKTKMESYNKISELMLNRFAEEVFKSGEDEKVVMFLESNPAKFYAIRDKSKAGGVFKLAVEKCDVIKEVSEYSIFSINVSSYNYKDDQRLVGEIFFDGDNVSGILSTKLGYSVRDAIRDPDFNFTTNIYDDILDQIPFFDKVYEYIVVHKLQGIIVEFAYFDKPVGVNNENIIIYELRTDY